MGSDYQEELLNCRAGRPQPDNREQVQQGGEEEACMAVLNNFYGDGKLSFTVILLTVGAS